MTGLDWDPAVSRFDPAEPRGPHGEWIELYHGTTSAATGAAIAANGLTADRYSRYNRVLTNRKDEAGYFATLGGKLGAVATIRVPRAEAGDYLDMQPGGGLASLKKPLPARMIHKVEYLGGEPMAAAATRAGFDPGKHPRGYHGRWAHLPGGLPFSRSGNVVSYHGSLGIDRKNMPQLSGLVGGQYVPAAHMMPKFLDYLRSRGIAAQHTTIPAAKLRPAQTTGDHQAIRGIADQLKSGAYPGKRITVSQDGRVIDGHHNWAGLLLANSEGHPGEQKVLQVGLPARELLAEMRAFAKREGIASRKAGEMANPEFASRTAMVVPGAEELVEALAVGRWPGAAQDSAPGAAGGTAGEEDGDGPEGRTGAPAVARGLTWDPAESVLGRAFNPREPRGPHGHWAKSPGPSQPPAAAPAMTPEQVTITEGIARAEARVAALEQARQLSEQQAADMHRMYGEMQRLTAKLKRETVAEAELQQRERKRARSKLLVHMGAIVAGIVLGGVEAKLGTPDLVSIASGGAPLAVQEITDWAKEL